MKLPILVMVASLLTSAVLAVFIFMKKKEMILVSKKSSFLDIKVRVTQDVLGEYQADVDKLQKQLDDSSSLVAELKTQLGANEAEAKKLKTAAEACQGEKKKMNDEITSIDGEQKNVKAQFDKEKEAWTKETGDLKQQMAQKSKVCAFVKKDSQEGNKLCGNEIPEAEKPAPEKPAPEKAAPEKAEAPKAEAPKAEAPKAEAPKAEAGKQK
ncbi:histone H1B [Megalops cyprinoides]|uniref:histone H1B n=1 Tax=Megalops cyprinoides TaxID=118141 RepID=UPI001863A1F4|nr:histone H1B [Megalops cyprinoides]